MTPAELLALVDLTRLERPDEPGAIDALAAKAVTPSGRVAALCVYPEWVERVAGATLRDTLHLERPANRFATR